MWNISPHSFAAFPPLQKTTGLLQLEKKQRPFSLQSEIHISVMCVGFLAQTAQADAKPSKRGGKLQAETWRGQSRYSETSTGGRADLKRRDEPAGCQSHHDHWPDFSSRQRGEKKQPRAVGEFLLFFLLISAVSSLHLLRAACTLIIAS